MPLTADFLRAFLTPCFVETGTYMGAGVRAAIEAGFERVVSIDIRDEAVAYARKALGPMADDPRVELVCGDSRDALPTVLRGLETEATFWLDAHFDFGVGGANPVEDELAAIAAHPVKTHRILLDDMAEPRDEKDWDDRTRRIIAALRAINPDYHIGWAQPSGSWVIMAAENSVRVGLLTVATGPYLRLAEEMVDSARAHLLDGHDLEAFVFTDRDVAPARPGAHVIPWRTGPWPDGTIRRYHAYWEHRARYEGLDFLLAMDADMRFVGPVGEEVVSDLTAVLHPGFTDKRGSYETRPESAAYVAPSRGDRYFCGGVVGGRPGPFLALARGISRAVDADAGRGVVAVWHDESHLNRRLCDAPPARALPPAYCHPEGCDWFTPTEPARILALAKNHGEMQA